MMRSIVCAAVLAVGVSAVFAADPGSTSANRTSSRSVAAAVALSQPVPDLNLDSVPVNKVIEFLRVTSGANIVVNWKALEAAGVAEDAPVSLQVKNLSMRKALQLVLDQASPSAGLTFDIDQNVISITTQDEADKVMITKVYIVDDLVMPDVDNIQPPQLSLQSNTQGGSSGGSNSSPFVNANQTTTGNTGQPSEQKGQDLVTLIREIVRPTIWKENGGTASMRYYNGKLIVTAPRSVHEAIGGNPDSSTGAIRVGM